MEILKLLKPVMINGVEVKDLKYDFDNMTAQDKLNAGKAYKKAGGVITVQELDSDYHLYIFAEAAAKANADIDQTDILLISARDAAKAEKLVRSFFFLDSEDTLLTSISEEQ
ncbi:hypothetical protein DFR58_10181 [Anaerobacterium chartisolvens]|uniref:Tail assembly chaperone E/41/14-like protein n=1 Tax=Anaerobacterium chartisolvens TaxID=1297424 RepID=A0A369BH48_9FIRM|nr:hypothetical protein [Anaerobacterium chartisolvens]RCX20879.1 hypothetical protein DFR58_10181 [Anaerobacterium chartisolvens]